MSDPQPQGHFQEDHADDVFARELEQQHARMIAEATDENQAYPGNPPRDDRVRSAVEVLRLLEKKVRQDQSADAAAIETAHDLSTRKPDGMPALASSLTTNLEALVPDLQRLGRFEIIEQIGRGGFGIVIRARDPQLGRDVALKIPRFETALSPDSRERFEREARAAAALNHPNIVGVHELGCENGIHYIASELVEGDNLSAWLARGHQPSPRQSAQLIATLADAVEHAHQRGVLHRDLKPGNVLLAAGDVEQPKITDFGLASIVEEHDFTQTGAVLGTPAYMSPEQAAGRKEQFGPATDVYGLGAVLYQLLTGRSPFAGLSLVELLRAIIEKDPAPVRDFQPDVPRDLEAICNRCLAREPGQRYPSARELQADLQRFINGESVLARPLTSLDRSLRWIKRNRLVSALSFALVAGLIVGIVSLSVLYRNSESSRQLAEWNETRYQEKSEQLSEAINKLFVNLARNPEIQNASADGLRRTLLTEVNEFQKIFLAETPEDPETQLEYARSLMSLASINELLGDLQNAVALGSTAIDYFELAASEIEVAPSERAGAYNLLGRCYTSMGQFDEAEQAIDSALDVFGSNMSGNSEDLSAQDLLEFAVAHTSQAATYLVQNRNDDAETAIQTADTLWQASDAMGSPTPDSHPFVSQDRGFFHLIRGDTCQFKGEYGQAISHYDKAIEEFEVAETFAHLQSKAKHTKARALRGIGICQAYSNQTGLAIGKYEEAIDILGPLVEQHPLIKEYAETRSQTSYSLIASHVVEGNYDVAEDLVDEHIEQILDMLQRFPDSNARYQNWLGEAWNIKYVALQRAGRITPEESIDILGLAIESFDQSVAASPDYRRPRMTGARARMNLANAFLALQDYERAFEENSVARQRLMTLIENEPTWTEAVSAYYSATVNRMIMHTQLHEYSEAMEMVDHLVERFPDHPRKHRIVMEKPGLMARAGQADEAKVLLRELAGQHRLSADLTIALAEKTVGISELDSVGENAELAESFRQMAAGFIEAAKPSDPAAQDAFMTKVRASAKLASAIDGE